MSVLVAVVDAEPLVDVESVGAELGVPTEEAETQPLVDAVTVAEPEAVVVVVAEADRLEAEVGVAHPLVEAVAVVDTEALEVLVVEAVVVPEEVHVNRAEPDAEGDPEEDTLPVDVEDWLADGCEDADASELLEADPEGDVLDVLEGVRVSLAVVEGSVEGDGDPDAEEDDVVEGAVVALADVLFVLDALEVSEPEAVEDSEDEAVLDEEGVVDGDADDVGDVVEESELEAVLVEERVPE